MLSLLGPPEHSYHQFIASIQCHKERPGSITLLEHVIAEDVGRLGSELGTKRGARGTGQRLPATMEASEGRFVLALAAVKR